MATDKLIVTMIFIGGLLALFALLYFVVKRRWVNTPENNSEADTRLWSQLIRAADKGSVLTGNVAQIRRCEGRVMAVIVDYRGVNVTLTATEVIATLVRLAGNNTSLDQTLNAMHGTEVKFVVMNVCPDYGIVTGRLVATSHMKI